MYKDRKNGQKETPTVRLELTTPGLEVRCAIQLRQPGCLTGIHLELCFERLSGHLSSNCIT